MIQSTIRMLVAEVDHGSDTATAAASPSAICPSRGARMAAAMAFDSRLRGGMMVVFAVIFTGHGGGAQHR